MALADPVENQDILGDIAQEVAEQLACLRMIRVQGVETAGLAGLSTEVGIAGVTRNELGVAETIKFGDHRELVRTGGGASVNAVVTGRRGHQKCSERLNR